MYEVVSPKNRVMALKVIHLQNLDARAKKLVENEVTLLKSLNEICRVIYLDSWHIDENKNCLCLVRLATKATTMTSTNGPRHQAHGTRTLRP